MGIWYATREQVKSSMEVAQSAWIDSLVDAKLEASSRNAEKFLRRRFYPELRTVKMDWPNYQSAPTWELQLNENELIELETLSSGGTSISTANVKLRRGDDLGEPPYSILQIDLSSSSSFRSGNTFQQAIEIYGLFGYSDTDTDVPAHALLGGNINSSVTTLTLSPSSKRLNVGVGSLIMIGTERMVLTERNLADTTQNTGGALTASNADKTVAVSDGTGFAKDEVITIGSERMKIDFIVGNNLTVSRAWDGTALDDHLTGVDIYAEREFTVQRGVLGSTAAAHTAADSVYAHQYPGPVNELVVAETVVLLEQNAAGYARTIGQGANLREAKGNGLEDIRNRAWNSYCRVKSRKGAI